MNFTKLEIDIKKKGFKMIAGMDEAGRGPLAGPVVAACVILPDKFSLEGIRDSKKMTDKQRRALYDSIKEISIDFGIGVIESDEIDSLNILNATKKAMHLSLNNMNTKPDFLLIDAVKDDWEIPSESLIKGEDKAVSIAAASILAKVYRDDLMIKIDEKYPEYDFKKHKGYGTIDHYIKIAMYGPSPVHRKSFEPMKSGIFSVDYYILEKSIRSARKKEDLIRIVESIHISKSKLTDKEIELLRISYMNAEKRIKKRLNEN